MLALAPLPLSDAVTTFIHEPFLNLIKELFILRENSFISRLRLFEPQVKFLQKSSKILDKTSLACVLVPDATQIFVLGNKIHLTTQNRLVSHDFPINRY